MASANETYLICWFSSANGGSDQGHGGNAGNGTAWTLDRVFGDKGGMAVSITEVSHLAADLPVRYQEYQFFASIPTNAYGLFYAVGSPATVGVNTSKTSTKPNPPNSSGTSATATTAGYTLPSFPSIGNLVLVYVATRGSVTAATPTDSSGETYTLVDHVTSAGGVNHYLFSRVALANDTNFVVSSTLSASTDWILSAIIIDTPSSTNIYKMDEGAYVNNGGNPLRMTLTATAHGPVFVAPSNTVLPAVSGTARVGQTLSTTDGTWTGTATITYTYQWKRGGVAIGGATANTYTLVHADAGSTITCTVTATNGGGSTTATSAATASVTEIPSNTVAPVITGSATVGSVLSCSTGTWFGTPSPTFTYQWKRAGSNIGGATSSTYTLVSADAGNTITCTVTGTNTEGSANVTTAPTGTVTLGPVNVVLPLVTGNALVGQTLTCNGGTWIGSPTPTLTYQWKRNGVDIGGATSATYVATSLDYGSTLSCRVTATNSVGTAAATSGSTPIISTPYRGVPATIAQVPHLAYPFRFAANGHARAVEQDQLEEVANCVQVILKTPSGFRVELPEFGCNEMVFQSRNRLDIDGVVAAVTQWEPRADADIVDSQIIEVADPSRVKLNVEVHGREGE